jgi:hypothetical protein
VKASSSSAARHSDPAAAMAAAKARRAAMVPAAAPAAPSDDDGFGALDKLAEQARSAPPVNRSAPTNDDGDLDLAPDPSESATAAKRTPTVVQPAMKQSAGGYARGPFLVVQDGATLPDRCIKCNAPAEGGRVTKRLAYNLDNSGPGSARFIPFVGRFVRLAWVIKQMATRQHLTVSFCVCPKHRTMRMIGMITLAIGLPAGIALVAMGAPKSDQWLIITGVIVMAVGEILGSTTTSLLSVHAGLNNGAEVRGAGRAFLASMPSPGASRRRIR